MGDFIGVYYTAAEDGAQVKVHLSWLSWSKTWPSSSAMAPTGAAAVTGQVGPTPPKPGGGTVLYSGTDERFDVAGLAPHTSAAFRITRDSDNQSITGVVRATSVGRVAVSPQDGGYGLIWPAAHEDGLAVLKSARVRGNCTDFGGHKVRDPDNAYIRKGKLEINITSAVPLRCALTYGGSDGETDTGDPRHNHDATLTSPFVATLPVRPGIEWPSDGSGSVSLPIAKPHQKITETFYVVPGFAGMRVKVETRISGGQPHLVGYAVTSKPDAQRQAMASFTAYAPAKGILEYRLTVPSTRTGYLAKQTVWCTAAIVSL